MTAKGDAVPSLCEWLGGAEVLQKLTVKFYERVLADDLLPPLFGEMSADHPWHVANFVGEVMGGAGRPAAGTRPCSSITLAGTSPNHSGGAE